jgi:pyruvate dehydrogenase E2 component (dihydrolipoamide acetyltransferase)
MVDVKLPELAEGVEEAEVVSVLISEGDEIEKDQNILELETDKAVAELPSPEGGKVTKIHVKAGDTVKVGDTILSLGEGGGEAEAKKEEAEKEKEPEKTDEEEAKEEMETGGEEEEPPQKEEEPEEEQEEEKKPKKKEAEKEPAKKAEAKKEEPKEESKAAGKEEKEEPTRKTAKGASAGPATRRLARELGVDVDDVPGSGPGGRVTEDDVRNYVRDLAAGKEEVSTGGPAPELPDFSEWGEIERKPFKGIRRKTAETVGISWRHIPHVTQHDVADITEFEATRKRYKGKEDAPHLTITAVAVKAAAIALQEFPQFNTSLDPDASELIYKHYYHIGVAVDTEHGLLVPVIRDVDRRSIMEIAAELEEVSQKARDRKLDISEMRGGTFTITNLGSIGGTSFTPIVLHPQVAILGMARGRREPVVREGGEIEPRMMLPLSLSYDHRVIDGADGARFVRRVAVLLSEPYEMVLRG